MPKKLRFLVVLAIGVRRSLDQFDILVVGVLACHTRLRVRTDGNELQAHQVRVESFKENLTMSVLTKENLLLRLIRAEDIVKECLLRLLQWRERQRAIVALYFS